MDMDDNQKRDDLEEAARLTEAAKSLSGALREGLEMEAAELRAKWTAPAELIALGAVSAGTRESDLAEAERLESVASTLRPGAGRKAVEAEAEALREKWPDFSDDP